MEDNIILNDKVTLKLKYYLFSIIVMFVFKNKICQFSYFSLFIFVLK